MKLHVLVSGSGGLVGSWLCEELLRRGHEVRAMIHYNGEKIAHLKDEVEMVRCDIRFPDECMEAAEGVNVIVHLAALIHVDRSKRYPRIFWETNVYGTMNMLEAARKNDSIILPISSCEIIGNVPTGKAAEDYPYSQPRSPYAASKFAGEAYSKSYQATYDMDIRIPRCFNIAGPRQKHGVKGGVIPTFIRRLLDGKPPMIKGTGLQTRDYTDVRDIVRGLAMLLEDDGLKGETIHFCSGVERSIKSIAYDLIEVFGVDLEPEYVEKRPGELMKSVGDNGKAKRVLGWRPVIPFEKTLRDMVDYERER